MTVTVGNVDARTRSREETRARLLESGRALFAERGVARVTTHDIARSAGVAAGTFYLHFKDKHALFREIVFDAISSLRERLEAAMDQAASPSEGVHAQSCALVDFAEKHADLVLIVFGPDSSGAQIEWDVFDYFADNAARIMAERSAQGRFNQVLNPTVAAQALTGMLAHVIAWWVADPTRASREDVIETLTHIQLEGTLPASAD